jgi:predicted alternative tryptophan synthase beta-subunit
MKPLSVRSISTGHFSAGLTSLQTLSPSAVVGISVGALTFAASTYFASKRVGALAPVPRAFRGGFEQEMSRQEALHVLGLPVTASPDEVSSRHKKLLIRNHPDRGGSTFLSAKINEAKERLTTA